MLWDHAAICWECRHVTRLCHFPKPLKTSKNQSYWWTSFVPLVLVPFIYLNISHPYRKNKAKQLKSNINNFLSPSTNISKKLQPGNPQSRALEPVHVAISDLELGRGLELTSWFNLVRIKTQILCHLVALTSQRLFEKKWKAGVTSRDVPELTKSYEFLSLRRMQVTGVASPANSVGSPPWSPGFPCCSLTMRVFASSMTDCKVLGLIVTLTS